MPVWHLHVLDDSSTRKTSEVLATADSLLPNDNTLSRFDFRLIALFLAGFATFIDLYSPQPVLPILRQYFGVSASTVSLTISASTTAVALSAPFMGLISDRYGRKPIICGSILALTIPTLLAATAGTLGQLVFWRFLQGLCLPGIIAVTMAYVSEEWPKGAGQPMAIYVSGTVLGGFAGRFLTGWVAAHSGWREAFCVLGAVNFVGGLVVVWALPASKNFKPHKEIASALKNMVRHLGNKALLATYMIAFSVLFCLVCTFNYISFHLSEPPYRMTSSQIGSVFFVYLVGVIVTPLSGRWIDRFGNRTMLGLGLGVSSLGVLLTLSQPILLVLLGLTLASSGIFVCQTAGSNRVGQVAKGARSSAAGLYASFYYLGGSFGAGLGGVFWNMGSWQAVVVLIVVVEMVALAAAMALWR